MGICVPQWLTRVGKCGGQQWWTRAGAGGMRMCATRVGAYVGCSGLSRDKWVAADLDLGECMRAIMVGHVRNTTVDWHGGNVGACGGLVPMVEWGECVGACGKKGRERWVHEGNSGMLVAVRWVHVVKGPPPVVTLTSRCYGRVRVDDVVCGWHSLEWMEVVVEVVMGGVGT